MSYAEKIREALERTKAARRADPELAARLDKFIAENAQLQEYFSGLTHDELVRALMRVQMKQERAEMTQRRNQVLAQWVSENPDVAAKIEAHVQNELAQKQAPKLNSTETIVENQVMRASRGIGP